MSDGHMVGGRYRVTRILASGFVAHVMAGVDTRDGRPVAIKVPRPRDENGISLALLRREAEILSKVKSPNLPILYESSLDDEAGAFLVTELLEGPATAEGELLAPARLAQIVSAAASALAALHAAGWIHCDVTPANLLRTGDLVKLIDFNISLPLGASNGGQFTGSPPYMAPELWRGDPVSPATDVYALAATAFALATGAPPFPVLSPLQAMRAHLEEPPPSLAARGATASPAIEAAIAAALAKDPAARPPSAADFARAFA